MEKRTRIWNQTRLTEKDPDFMTHSEQQDAFVDMFYHWTTECRGGCGYHLHVGEFMDTQNGVCPNCKTEHETFMPMFPQSTMGRVIFKKKSTKE